MGMDALPGLSPAINTGRPPYPGERPSLQGVMILLHQEGGRGGGGLPEV